MTWAECQECVRGYKRAVFKKFASHTDAVQFVRTGKTPQPKRAPAPAAAESAPPEGVTIIYTDGSCDLTSDSAGAGVYFGPNDIRNLAAPVPGAQTNQRAELYAILLALQKTQDCSHLWIRTDSLYSINVITRKWSANANLDILNNIWENMRNCATRSVEFQHVRGHQGIVGNEMADSLANKARAAYVQARNAKAKVLSPSSVSTDRSL